jgi:hypothetical protein
MHRDPRILYVASGDFLLAQILDPYNFDRPSLALIKNGGSRSRRTWDIPLYITPQLQALLLFFLLISPRARDSLFENITIRRNFTRQQTGTGWSGTAPSVGIYGGCVVPLVRGRFAQTVYFWFRVFVFRGIKT